MKNAYVLGAALAAAALPTGAQAVTLVSGQVVSATYNTSLPGLQVLLGGIGGLFNAGDVETGDKTVSLFTIRANERDVQSGEDTLFSPISVLFQLSSPSSATGEAYGDTFGQRLLGGLIQNGRVTWDGPVDFDYGYNGIIRLSLSSETFSEGLFGLGTSAATVKGTFNLYKVTDPFPTVVPEPATWALMILGFGLIGGTLRTRRRQQVRVTYA